MVLTLTPPGYGPFIGRVPETFKVTWEETQTTLTIPKGKKEKEKVPGVAILTSRKIFSGEVCIHIGKEDRHQKKNSFGDDLRSEKYAHETKKENQTQEGHIELN